MNLGDYASLSNLGIAVPGVTAPTLNPMDGFRLPAYAAAATPVTPGFTPPVDAPTAYARPAFSDARFSTEAAMPYSGGLGDQATTDWLGGLGNLFKGAIGTKEAPGWGGMALGGMQALGSLYMGMKQYGLAKQTLAENKRQFQLNYDAQKSGINADLEDRQRARVAANAGAYQSVGDYMNQHGIK